MTATKKLVQEVMQLIGFRLTKDQRGSVKKLSKKFSKERKEKTSESQVVREAIEAYAYQNL